MAENSENALKTEITNKLSSGQLLKIANDNHIGLIQLSETEKGLLLEFLREKGRDELELGQEMEHEKVRLVRRVTGAVSIFFEKDEPAPAKKKAKE
ncbi:MAG: hypothetical protein KGS72_18805 [Cyanobacteria bacterium REEB67]|nr:hypothetical protein [Cyanobacteria bacterium REEB67]